MGTRLVDAYTAATGFAGGSGSVRVLSPESYLSARLRVPDLAIGAVEVLAGAVNRLLGAAGLSGRDWVVRPDRVAASYSSDKLIRIDGASINAFAPLSGFFETADGWIRTHANYPHHRDRLASLVGLGTDATRDDFVAAVATRRAHELEELAAAAGALVIALRTESAWRRAHWDAITPDRMPIVDYAENAAGGATGGVRGLRADSNALALHGIRVLDLTRVLAGPVAGRDLALLGAEVLRIDPPDPPEIEWQHTVTGQGKRSALLDLRSGAGARRFADLLADADVLLTGYRPGALHAFGLDEVPGLVHGSVQAWEPHGAWADRRGFDSLVQAATGISWVEGGDTPGALPVQALDHASGHLLAAGVVDALARQIEGGGGARVRVVLERTARWLLDAPGRASQAPPAAVPGPETVVTHDGVTLDRPALAEYDDYPYPARAWGRDDARW